MSKTDFLGMKLSEFVDSSLKAGLVPAFRFVDKDSVQTEVSAPYISPSERTHAQTLEHEVRFFHKLIIDIQASKDASEDKDVIEKCEILHNNIINKIAEYEKAIELLAKN